MTTYNTKNPVPSADARDRYDNSQVFDDLMNGAAPSTPDRLGVLRQSWAGMEQAFAGSEADRAAAFQAFLDASGWSTLGDYAAGISIISHTQTVDYQGQPYHLKPSVPASVDAPYLTAGDWGTEGDNFKLVGDNSLRQDLAASDGVMLVSGATVSVNSVADLISLPSSVTQPVYTLGYAVAGDGGGTGPFVWEPTSTDPENGGTIFGTGTGRRVLANFDTYNIKWFGAKGDGVTDDQVAVDKFIAAWITDQKDGYVPSGEYKMSGRWLVNVGLNKGKRCPKLYGDGAYSSIFVSTSLVSPVFHIYGQSAQVGPDHFYGAFDRIGFSADVPGIGFAVGLPDFSDNHGNYHFNQVFFANYNSSSNDSATTLQLNWLFDCSFNQCVVIGKPMYGTALNCRRTHFVHFTSGSYSNAGRAIAFTDGGSYSTTFDTYDIENCKFGAYVDDPAAEDIAFNNGYMDIFDPIGLVYPAGAYPIYVGSTQRGGVTFNMIRFGRAQSSLYAYPGFGTPGAISPSSSFVNFVIHGRFSGQEIDQPAMPATDVAITNDTGQVQTVRVGASTSVFINGLEYGNTAGSSHTINPGDVIAVRYSGATPNWQWSALR